MADLSAIPTEDLQTEFVALGDQLSTVATRRTAILAELDARRRRAEAVTRLSTLTEDQRAALKSVL